LELELEPLDVVEAEALELPSDALADAGEAVDEPALLAAVVEAEEDPAPADAVCVPGVKGDIVVTAPLTDIALLTTVTEVAEAAADEVVEDPEAAVFTDELADELSVDELAEELSVDELEEEEEILDEPDEFEVDDEVLLLLEEVLVVEVLFAFIATVQFLTSWTAGLPLESVTGVNVMTQVCVRGPAGVIELVTCITVVGAES
jgi:hypothetical protein